MSNFNWKKKHVLGLLETWYTDSSIVDFCEDIGIEKKEFFRKLTKIISNTDDKEKSVLKKVLPNLPNFEGKDWSNREIKLLKRWHTLRKENKLSTSAEYIAWVLRRSYDEAYDKLSSLIETPESKKLKDKNSEKITHSKIRGFDEDILADLVFAHRYLYYISNTPVISDKYYDELEAELLEFQAIPKDSPLRKPGSDKKKSYPLHVQALAHYMAFKYSKRDE